MTRRTNRLHGQLDKILADLLAVQQHTQITHVIKCFSQNVKPKSQLSYLGIIQLKNIEFLVKVIRFSVQKLHKLQFPIYDFIRSFDRLIFS